MMPARTLFVAVMTMSVGACASEESRQMKNLSGTYVLATHDTLAAQYLRTTTLTLRPDGRWTRVIGADTAFKSSALTDSGTYRANGRTIAVRFGDGPMTYAVKGDTLMWDTAEKERLTSQTEAITGVKLVGQVETFYVRQR